MSNKESRKSSFVHLAGEAVIERIDHFVITVRSLEGTCRFYERVLGFEVLQVAGKPTALKFANQKINVHQADHTFEPKAANPTPGAADFCLITAQPLEEVLEHLKHCGVQVELGPIARNGALGPMQSVYFRDPDANLVEVSHYDAADG